jgi:hypothetical protein
LAGEAGLQIRGLRAVRWALTKGPWAHVPYPGGTELAGASGALAKFYREGETLLALELASAFRHVLVRLLSGLTVGLCGLVVLLRSSSSSRRTRC